MHGKSHLAQLRFHKFINDSIIRTTPSTSLCELTWSKSTPSLFSRLLRAATLRKSTPTAKQLHCLIVTSGSLDRFLSNQLLNMYVKLREFETAITLFDHIPLRNAMSCNIMINACVRGGDLARARTVFDEMPERNAATWNAMIAGLIHFEHNGDGLGLFVEMNESGFLPDEFALGSALRGCAGLRALCAGRQVHGFAVKLGFEVDLVVGSSLSHMYMKSGGLEEGERVISSMPTRNMIAWNTLIAGKAQGGKPEEVLENYSLMKIAGFKPDKITFVSVSTSCAETTSLEKGRQIHAEAIKSGASSAVSVITSLVTMYSKCGILEDSVKAFMESNDVADSVLWSSMISAYGFHGRGEEAIEFFERMEKEGLTESDDVAFLSLLHVCSHCGLKEKGLELFDKMVEKYGMNPRLEHYNCIVDLLGRSGSLDEAEAMIRSMPVKPDAIIWKTLLSACRVHKNAEMAGRVAEEVLKLDPHDSALYVLLSNVHASEKRWSEVSKVREAMRNKNIRRERGMSWFGNTNRGTETRVLRNKQRELFGEMTRK